VAVGRYALRGFFVFESRRRDVVFVKSLP